VALLPLTPDELLSTTRAVRRRLDLGRPVEAELIEECAALAQQAPNGGNSDNVHFVVVSDLPKKQAIAEIYRRVAPTLPEDDAELVTIAKARNPDPQEVERYLRILRSAVFLYRHLHEVPRFVVPCIEPQDRMVMVEPEGRGPGIWSSVLPAAWSFMLAARARGLGTVLTTYHLRYEEEVAAILEIPYPQVFQAALIPVAYTVGTDFRPGPRGPVEKILHWDAW
jgi:nitroreductase